MATKKKTDFAAADRGRYAGIIQNAENAENVENAKKETRHYNRLDPRKEAPAEYRYTARMPGELGRFINELAYQRRSTITAEITRLVREEMERHPEIMASLDELND
jgi:hypothetical protein